MSGPSQRVLAGDIGGTHTRLALYRVEHGRPQLLEQQVFESRHHDGLGDIIHAFTAGQSQAIEATCLGVAGPVHDQVADLTNLPWQVNGAELAGALSIGPVVLLNDLEATGWGLETLGPDDLHTLQAGAAAASGNRAIIAAGTGLGQAGVYGGGGDPRPFACEGGHTDFSPQSELDVTLLRHLQRRYQHVSWERVVSGSGLVDLHACLCELRQREAPDWLVQAMADGDPAAAISSAAQRGDDALCIEALQWFCHLYGAEAGNLALKLMATGGVYVAGGIAPKILDALQDGRFLEAFRAKGRMRVLMQRMPVQVVLSGDVALQGAARCAAGLAAHY